MKLSKKTLISLSSLSVATLAGVPMLAVSCGKNSNEVKTYSNLNYTLDEKTLTASSCGICYWWR